ncbi:helix-turn-helix domain-containing protein [Staphylococcus equorum]|uniref:Helix-turn-helix domain-containing protein n=1 Tax=Staphylococcus equorum TaxID=246432 RepID=A0A9X4QYN5_9STAP|nr:helix-turn-helix transcriptional regulator [Staphylococcus equorum]MDG0818821.1 helix-turn-helix domain-containing protein [Staphylococcus equorum]MDG0839462.1 helix-turn-helix domain-containing protein [Staphylococcus equorum]MDG0844812.1 helix-turn-helix domain-containing protein [Staphylococcus equorum]
MNTFQRIQNLANKNGLSIAELERILNLSNGSIARWKKSAPSSKGLTLIADYFDVSVDYLLGREKEEYSGEKEDEVQMFRDKDAFDNLSPEDQEKVLETLREQADFLIHKYQKHKGNK